MIKKDLMICPKCGSTNSRSLDKTPLGVKFLGGISPQMFYECLDCGYEGIFPIIDESDVKQYQTEIKNIHSK